MKKTITYAVGDNVWLMHGNLAVCATVTKVSYKQFISSDDPKSIIEDELYTLSVGDKPLLGLHGKDELYSTKSDLINSL